MTSTSIDDGALAGASDVDLRRRVIGRAPGAGPVYDGRVGELFGLWLKTLLLSILTLGFYRFWGRTRIRKYLWSRVSLDGDRFEYDGTGGELFRRFLVTVAILAPLLLVPVILDLLGVDNAIVSTTQLALYSLLTFLALVGYYAGRRYRMSRTTWRGMRGGLDGSAAGYAGRALLVWLLNGLTLGLYVPWARTKLWSYEANHLRFGDGRFEFEGSGRELFGAWVVSYLVVLGAALIGVAVILGTGLGGEIREAFIEQDRPRILIYFFGIIAAVLLLPAILMILFLRFQARWLSFMVGGTSFGEVTINARIGAWRLLRLTLGNMVLMLLTIGLGWPFVAHRTLRFLCGQIDVQGIESLRTLAQSAPPQRGGAEGLSQLLQEGGFA
jgi:uncharacterized membrane protein YjgN (DUF898 family)